ncbi:Ubiquinone/menaquinone biosynthesis C-methylase UbiE [Fodinibius salinus]|uniref:Arsenite methyltransferase n=1 Tax=Fodinibius salinus TaxID=860790 RepID=A0A5D3YJG8_9BACT|nr:arsenite methyltransferase [Fodinibius salinus]TYP93658.1 Ubiquinone/menaquinone biosynthesis C-methylase UbiE [Fodinibius salinus]
MKTDKQTSDELKETVKKKYAAISEQSRSENEGSCCGTSCGCDTVDYAIFADDYSEMGGYNQDADLGLGCGLPTEHAHISKGDTVVDLGSGAGNDCFVARELTGSTGRVIGLDMTQKMIDKAEANTDKLGFENVEFVLGDIEDMPLEDGLADVVVSNCVMNLVPDKPKAFAETYRIIKPGGHFSISDVVTSGDLPPKLNKDAEMYAGCVSGAINKKEYLEIVRKAGFTDLKIQKEKRIRLPDEILSKYLAADELEAFKNSGTGIFSITLYAKKAE